MYGLCPEELRDDLMRWISKIIHKDIHVKLQRQKGLGRRIICCFEDPLKKKKEKAGSGLILEEGFLGEVIE